MQYKSFRSVINLAILVFLLCWAIEGISQTEKEFGESVVKETQGNQLEWGGCPDFMPAGCNIAVLHGDPSRPNTDILFRVPANTDIPEHWHHSAERMLLVSGEMEVTYQDEKTQLLKPGFYAYGPARKPHSAKCGDAGPCVLFIAFEEPVDAFAVSAMKKE